MFAEFVRGAHYENEPKNNPTNQQIKQITLTPTKQKLKQRIETEILNDLPWRYALNNDERACLLQRLQHLSHRVLPLRPAGRGRHCSLAHASRGQVSRITDRLKRSRLMCSSKT